MLPLWNTQNIMERPLPELQELRTFWRKQNFVFSAEQQIRYDRLTKQRQDQVKSFYENNRVYKAWFPKYNIGSNRKDENI